MPTNHRNQYIGAHNHSNIVRVIGRPEDERLASTDGTFGTIRRYKTLRGPNSVYETFSSTVPDSDGGTKYSSGVSVQSLEDSRNDREDKGFDIADEASYSNPRRAEMAGIARANRHARTGDWGDQGDIIERRNARKAGK